MSEQIDNTTEEENEPCYCLSCDWSGHEAELVEKPLLIFLTCPKCGSTDIVYK